MTNELTLRAFDIPSIHKFAVGFDSVFNELSRAHFLQSNVNYPPFNVVQHSDDRFSIELAVAGFNEGDIDVTLEKNVLTIQGKQAVEDNLNGPVYLHRGISARSFTRSFTLAEHVEVEGADVNNGILTIDLERKVPEEQKPKTIAVSYKK